MFRKEITDGDLLLTYKPPHPFGKHEPYRNLSEEVRKLGKLRDEARAKYLKLQRLHVIANTNVVEELETLQYHLFHNSKAYFETGVNSSILEEREGTRYKFNRSDNGKQGASSNKDKQKANQQKQKESSRKGSKVVSVMDLIGAKIVLH